MTQDQFKEEVASLVKKVCLTNFQSFCQQKDAQISSNVNRLDLPLYTQMVMIMISGPLIEQKIKIFFNPKDVIPVVKLLHKNVTDDEFLIEQLSGDIFKEVANLSAGHMKRLYENSGLECEISLPILLRGYDELFFEKKDKASHMSYWYLSSGCGRVGYSSTLKVGNIEKSIKIIYEEKGGEIEVF